VVQDTLIQVCRKLRWLERPESFRPWVFRICSRLAFRHLRKHRGIVSVPLEDAALEEREAATVVGGAEIEALVADTAVSPASRAVLLLHFREELPLADVAAVLEIPLGTVKSRLAYGLKTLRAHMKGVCNGR
jgi:RNA polymerase sigma-70 factor (ECF subfamily)